MVFSSVVVFFGAIFVGDRQMQLKKKHGIAILISGLLAMTSTVQASNYSFDYRSSDNTYKATGAIVTSDLLNAMGGYDILSISGSVTGALGGTITGLVSNPNQPSPYTYMFPTGYGFTFDNILFPAAGPDGFFDLAGVLFRTGPGKFWNLFGNLGTYELLMYDQSVAPVYPDFTVETSGRLEVAKVSEPGTSALMAIALATLGALKCRRKRSP